MRSDGEDRILGEGVLARCLGGKTFEEVMRLTLTRRKGIYC